MHIQEMLRDAFNVNLSERAQALLHFLENVDPCFLSLVVAVLVLLGSKMVAGQPKMRGWGLRLAVATFLLYFGYKYYITDIGSDHKQLVGIGMRSACMAGGVLAFTWIIVPIASFVLRHIRLAAAAFLLFGAYLLITANSLTMDQLPFFAFQASIAAALALIVAWITEPFWKYALDNWFPERKAKTESQNRAHPEQVPPEMVIPLPIESPRRQRQTMLAPSEAMGDLKDDLETLRERDGQRRREKARLQLELLFMQAGPVIGNWFTREMFDDFVQRHLGDQHPPSDVEENARQLQSVLQQHMEEAQGNKDFVTMEDLTRWLLAEQQRIQSQPGEQPEKQSQLLDLHQRYLALASRLVQHQKSLP